MLIFVPHCLIRAVNLILCGRTLKWWTKFARLMRLFLINVAECNLKPSLECFKTFGIQKIACGAHSFLYFTITVANYSCCEKRMTHQENQHSRFACVLHVLCMWQLFAFLPKISCKHGAFHSVWEIEFLFIFRIAMKTKLPKTFRIDCFKGEHPVFQGCLIVAETCMLKSQGIFLILWIET